MKRWMQQNPLPQLPENASQEQWLKWRRDIEEWGTLYREQIDHEQRLATQELFTSKEGLDVAIAERILPSIVFIQTASGKTGMGFFQHDQWLVSNAHVIAHRDDLAEGVKIVDADGNTCEIDAEQSFHRPHEISSSPDVVIIKANSRPGGKRSALPTCFSDDESDNKLYYFYIDNKFEVHFLQLASQPGRLPLEFTCELGEEPRLGCSGTLIFSARVIHGHDPEWQFNTVGALYGRRQELSTNQWYACGVPVRPEFDQILSVLHGQDMAVRYDQFAQASRLLGDQRKVIEYEQRQQQASDMAELKIKCFEAGDSPLFIELPDDLEKLSGTTVVLLAESYLITQGKISRDNIESSFKEFVRSIRDASQLKLSIAPRGLMKNKLWRLDCTPGTDGTVWNLQLQDNTNNSKTSSVFGQVCIPRNMGVINGAGLAEDMLRCQENLKCKKNNEQRIKSINNSLKKVNRAKKKELESELAKLDKPIQIIWGENDSQLARYQVVPEVNPVLIGTYQEFVTFFHPNGAPRDDRVEEVDGNGNTPLMVLLKDSDLAQSPDKLKKIAALHQFGASWNKSNGEGKTAVDLLESQPAKEKISLRLAQCL